MDVGQVEEKQITRKQKELSEKASILKERIAFLRNCLCPVLTKLPERAMPFLIPGLPVGRLANVRQEGAAPLYDQLAAIAETMDCTISDIEGILSGLEI